MIQTPKEAKDKRPKTKGRFCLVCFIVTDERTNVGQEASGVLLEKRRKGPTECFEYRRSRARKGAGSGVRTTDYCYYVQDSCGSFEAFPVFVGIHGQAGSRVLRFLFWPPEEWKISSVLSRLRGQSSG